MWGFLFLESYLMSKSIVHARNFAAHKQDNLCYYCGVLMLLGEPGLFLTKHRVSKRQARLLQCTAEHVVPRCDGGTNGRSNIVAACFFCNHTRHARPQPLDTPAYKRFVQHRVARGRWLLASLPSSLRRQA
ncbi:HNH endonuclease [Lysobacter sp. A378]